MVPTGLHESVYKPQSYTATMIDASSTFLFSILHSQPDRGKGGIHIHVHPCSCIYCTFHLKIISKKEYPTVRSRQLRWAFVFDEYQWYVRSGWLHVGTALYFLGRKYCVTSQHLLKQACLRPAGLLIIHQPSASIITMNSASASASTKPSPPALVKNEDVLVLILGWCPLKSIGRMGQCCKTVQSILSYPKQQFWFGHLIHRLNIPSREVGNVNIASDQSAKSFLKTHIHAESIRSSPQGRPRENESFWDYHRDNEPTLAIEATNGGWDTYKIDHMVDEESSRYGSGHDFAARCRHSPVPHMPCPVVRRRRDGKIDVQLSSISYFEVRLVSRTGHRQRRPNNALPEDGEGMVQPPPQACVAVGYGTSCFRLSGYEPGWTEDSIGYHSDDGR